MSRAAEVTDGRENMAYENLGSGGPFTPVLFIWLGCSTSLAMKRIISILDVETKEKTLEKISF